jgi:hypothetical protein
MSKRRVRPMDKKLTKPSRPPRARTATLPGMENRTIQELEDLGHQYATKRDERMDVGREEKALKVGIIALMHKHGKTHYVREGLEITLLPKDEDVKVKVKPDEDEDEDDTDDEDEDDEDNGEATDDVSDPPPPPMGDPPSTLPPIREAITAGDELRPGVRAEH